MSDDDSFEINMTDKREEQSGIEDDDFWSEESFIESVSEEEMKEKEKTIHKKHDEDMNFNCAKCNEKISAHNKDWHAGICDDCFNKKMGRNFL